MTKEVTNRMNSGKLPDCPYTQTGVGTLQDLCRAHFWDSRLIHLSTWWPGAMRLISCIPKTHVEVWYRAIRAIHKSKIKWHVNTFKPLNSPGSGTDEIVISLLHHCVEHLASYLCYISRNCLAFEVFTTHGVRLNWRLYTSTNASYTKAKASRSIKYKESLQHIPCHRGKIW